MSDDRMFLPADTPIDSASLIFSIGAFFPQPQPYGVVLFLAGFATPADQHPRLSMGHELPTECAISTPQKQPFGGDNHQIQFDYLAPGC
jgi:hypothetical protein